jgi:hypothetical protein
LLGLHCLLCLCEGARRIATCAGSRNDGQGNQKGRQSTNENAGQNGNQSPFGCHGDIGKDASRRRRGHQPRVRQNKSCRRGHPPGNHGEDGEGIHQDVGEVDFVNAAQKVNNDGSGRGLLDFPLTAQPVRREQAESGARIALQQKEDGFAGLLRFGYSQRRQDTVVDGVVDEQDFSRFDDQ